MNHTMIRSASENLANIAIARSVTSESSFTPLIAVQSSSFAAMSRADISDDFFNNVDSDKDDEDEGDEDGEDDEYEEDETFLRFLIKHSISNTRVM